MNRPRIARADLDTLRRLAEGWCPLNAQIPNGMALERRGLLRLDWGPQGTPDENRMGVEACVRGYCDDLALRQATRECSAFSERGERW